jgi:hypothetical protein
MHDSVEGSSLPHSCHAAPTSSLSTPTLPPSVRPHVGTLLKCGVAVLWGAGSFLSNFNTKHFITFITNCTKRKCSRTSCSPYNTPILAIAAPKARPADFLRRLMNLDAGWVTKGGDNCLGKLAVSNHNRSHPYLSARR